MAERSKAAVLKTVDLKGSWGSNPYLSAKIRQVSKRSCHFYYKNFKCFEILRGDGIIVLLGQKKY